MSQPNCSCTQPHKRLVVLLDSLVPSLPTKIAYACCSHRGDLAMATELHLTMASPHSRGALAPTLIVLDPLACYEAHLLLFTATVQVTPERELAI